MNKLKRAAAVAVMVGGLGLAGGGVASASGGPDCEDPSRSAMDNLQVASCEQAFEGGLAFAPVGGGEGAGDGGERSIGNFCSAVNVED